jgi:spore cortex formation protein SpoVR/YcgB (stage V sporulation)
VSVQRIPIPVALGVVLLAGGMLACTRASTSVGREVSARPRVEQVALSAAMEAAYNKVDFAFCRGRKCFVETKALSKTDIDFITSYVTKKVLTAGGFPVLQEANAEITLTSTLEVSGTDEVKRTMVKDVVIGQFKGTLAIIDRSKGTVVQAFDLKAVSQTKRNKTADTTILEH